MQIIHRIRACTFLRTSVTICKRSLPIQARALFARDKTRFNGFYLARTVAHAMETFDQWLYEVVEAEIETCHEIMVSNRALQKTLEDLQCKCATSSVHD